MLLLYYCSIIVAYVVVAHSIKKHDRVAAFFNDHAPEVFDRLFERQLR